MKLLFLSVFCFCSALVFSSQSEELLAQMSLEQKIAQLFVLPAVQGGDEEHQSALLNMVRDRRIGGVLLKQGDPEGQVAFINRLQREAQTPLLCCLDAERGLSQRLTGVVSFPFNLTLGAIQDDQLLYLLGREIGRQCKMVGGHINFAPVVDVNINPDNPVIHMRSFGEDPKRVAQKARHFVRGMREQGILACAKHFPGHGDTSTDSHEGLPEVNHSRAELNALDLYPYRPLIDDQIDAIMLGHLYFPCLDTLPTTLSATTIRNLLRRELHFEGLVVTDALNMGALQQLFIPGEIALQALLAGCDLLTYGDHRPEKIAEIHTAIVPLAMQRIKEAIEEGLLDIDQRVLKILQTKERLGLFDVKEVPLSKMLLEELNSQQVKNLKSALYRAAITVVENRDALLPLALKRRIALLHQRDFPAFTQALQKYATITSFAFDEREKLLSQINSYDCLIVSLDDLKIKHNEFSLSYELTLSEEMDEFLQTVRAAPTVLALFGTPYSLSKLPSQTAIVIGYEKEPEAAEAVADILFGKLIPQGRLPVSSGTYPVGRGITWTNYP